MQLRNITRATGAGPGVLLLTGFIACLFGVPVTAAVQQYGIIEYPQLHPPVAAYSGFLQPLAAGPGGAIWFAFLPGSGQNFSIARIMPSGAITQYPIPIAGPPVGIAAGADGALWFQIGSAIGRMTTSGVFTFYPLPEWWSYDGGITLGPDGNMWFVSDLGIGYVTPGAIVTRRIDDVSGYLSAIGEIVTGSDGNLWVVGNGITRCSTAFVCKNFPFPKNTFPYGASFLTEGPDGAVWFTGDCGPGGCYVGRIDTEGAYSSFPVPGVTGIPELSQISAGSDGALWFGSPGQIIRMTTSGVITKIPLPDPNAFFGAMVPGLGGMWFTETGRIGLVAPLSASLTATPNELKQASDVTLTGSGFAPGETVGLLYSSELGKTLPKTIAADSTGSFVIAGEAGPSLFGDGSVSAFGQSSGRLGVATVMVNPRLILEPNSGSVGDTITASGSGLSPAPGSAYPYYLYWKDPFVFLGTATVNAVGEFTGFTFNIPAGALPGEQLVVASPFSIPYQGGPYPVPNGTAAANVNVLASGPIQ